MGKGARNRANRTRILDTDSGLAALEGSNIFYETSHRKAEDPGPGEHLWVMMTAHRVVNPERLGKEKYYFDMENIITVEGPGCYKCEESYSPEIASKKCTGDVNNLQ
jgi:hypothetical protein